MAEYPKAATITQHTFPHCYLLGSARPIDFNVSLKRESNASALVPIRKSSIVVLSSPLDFLGGNAEARCTILQRSMIFGITRFLSWWRLFLVPHFGGLLHRTLHRFVGL